MATTPRGYPLFTGGQSPAGPAQMQQLANAIDADVTATKTAVLAAALQDKTGLDNRLKAIESPARPVLTTNNPGLYGPRGGGYQTPQLVRTGKQRHIQGSFTNIVTINFQAATEYPLLTLPEGDRPGGLAVFPVWVAAGTGNVIIKPDGAVTMFLSSGSYAGGAWAIDLSPLTWFVP